MALSHPGPVQGEQVVVGEHLDAVVVPGRGRKEVFSKGPNFNGTNLSLISDRCVLFVGLNRLENFSRLLAWSCVSYWSI